MLLQGKIRQYKTIVEALQPGKGKSRKQLMLRLEAEGFLISPRTYDRLMEDLRFEFGISIHYDPTKNQYLIAPESLPAIDAFLQFCKAGEVAEFIQSLLISPSETLNHISFGNGSELRGIHLLQPLLQSITNRQPIRFMAENQKGTVKEVVMEPYMLREYGYRWFVVGYLRGEAGTGDLRCFAVDKITELEALADHFEPRPDFPYGDLFRDLVGVGIEGEKEKLHLRVYPPHDRQLLAFPLHPSQKILKEGKEFTEIEMKLVVNDELEQRLLQLGAAVEVLEPKGLRKSIRNQLREALKYYK